MYMAARLGASRRSWVFSNTIHNELHFYCILELMRGEWQAYCVHRARADARFATQIQVSLGSGSRNPSEVLNRWQRVSGLTKKVLRRHSRRATTWHVERHGRARTNEREMAERAGNMHRVAQVDGPACIDRCLCRCGWAQQGVNIGVCIETILHTNVR